MSFYAPILKIERNRRKVALQKLGMANYDTRLSGAEYDVGTFFSRDLGLNAIREKTFLQGKTQPQLKNDLITIAILTRS
ncbi:hypothetical protein AK51_31565 [Serratia nematodiphila DZ0503SBS1]|nr:hypothetical protein AK51_31565 [Serratia nematodiphila DZ0503SBS1]